MARIKKDTESTRDMGAVRVLVYTGFAQSPDPGTYNVLDSYQDAPGEVAEKALKGKSVSHGTS